MKIPHFFESSKLKLYTLLGVLFTLASCLQSAKEAADMVLTNGKVYTVDNQRSWAEAIAIKNGKIVEIGSSEDIRKRIDENTKVIDLAGRLVLPGLHDAHLHPISGAEASRFCQLTGLFQQDAILRAVKKFADTHPEAPVIRGRGWEMAAFPGSNPHKSLLDSILPDRPVVLTSWDGHNYWVNSKALELAGITKDTPDPNNGRIERDPNTGVPSGTLRETAMGLISSILPKKAENADEENLKLALEMANELGITSMMESSAGKNYLKAYKKFADEGKLTARIVTSIGLGTESPRTVAELVQMRDKYQGERLNTNSVKVFADGVPEARTAAMLQPYITEDEKKDFGILNFSLETLKPLFDSLDGQGFQIHIHALGDRAVRVALDALTGLDTAHRHHLAHLQVIHPDDIPRFGSLGVIANFQPFWAKPDPLNIRTIIPLVGQERSKQMYPMGSVQKTGGLLVAGSDWPVSTLNPWHAMQVAVTRQMIGVESTPWIPSEAVDLPSIIAAYTRNAAYCMHQENITGSLEVGKMADLIVLNQNIFEIAPTEIHDTKVLVTLLEGEVVYQDKENALVMR